MKHYQKFVFLGAIIAVALFSRFAYPAVSSIVGAKTAVPSLAAETPLFDLSQTASSSNDVSAGNGAVSVSSSDSSVPTSFVPAGDSPFTDVGNEPPPVIADQESLIADLRTGDVFLGTNIDKRWPLASVTKLMTASIVLDNIDMDQRITITPEAMAVDPTQTILNVGDTYTASDLLRIMLLPSSNVAAEAFADYYGRTAFLAAMNARAAEWGMTSTHYDDPSGLSAGNETTASDLLKLGQNIDEQYPQILAITRTPQVVVTEQNTGQKVVIKSINDFAGRSDFIGGKTGYTDEADGNLLSIFDYENRPVLVVVMGTNDSDRFNNTLLLYNWFTANFK